MIQRHVLENDCAQYQSLRFRADHNYRDALADRPNRVVFEC